MEHDTCFDRNLLALSLRDPGLCSRLSAAETTTGRYRFLPARTGDPVPAVIDGDGSAHPLHSLVDPGKEAERLVGTLSGGGFVIFLGLGAAYAVSAALARADVQGVGIIEFGINGIAELFASVDYVHIFRDPRVRLLVDPSAEELREYILTAYRPALFGGFAMVPLRPRINRARLSYEEASETIREAIGTVSDDYSVQAYFGRRWYANTLRNLFLADRPQAPLPPIRKAAVCAAGPSLEAALPRLAAVREDRWLIATDTSLPALRSSGLTPDAVVSIDCQHISYYHFMEGMPEGVPLFMDLASPPVVAARTECRRFFSGGHPLTTYISRRWKPFPLIDTSGGNVTYAAVSLADFLGAELIELYGADFSYPKGAAYARGTYIHPLFQRRQNRLEPLESCFTSFVFRNESLRKLGADDEWRYETKPLALYRERLEALAPRLAGTLQPIQGTGAPIRVLQGPPRRRSPERPVFASGRAAVGVPEFLEEYRRKIAALPPMAGAVTAYLQDLEPEAKDVLTTLLPAAAELRRREGDQGPEEILEKVRRSSIEELDLVLSSLRT